MKNKLNYAQSKSLKSLSLGKQTKYIAIYDANLLQGVPRSLNRDALDLDENKLPFVGFDLWNIYELSWLNKKGKPQVATGVVKVPFDSCNIIESKSFKLYLNSFNQTKFDSIEDVRNTITSDLTKCVNKEVNLSLNQDLQHFQDKLGAFTGSSIDDLDIEIDQYQLEVDLLNDLCSNETISEKLYSNLLKSNCLITSQPDWASIEIEYTGNKIVREKLLRYLISFRDHNEFHEQCIERIYCDLMKFGKFEKLSVYARYTRRGGLDINPFRTNQHNETRDNLRLLRQ